MLFLISPAKKLADNPSPSTLSNTQPVLLDDAQTLVDQLKPMAPHQLSELMHLSDNLGQLNAGRYHDWQQPFTEENAASAIYTFKGDVYAGLDAESLNEKETAYIQKRLRILSGLYGLLKPFDLMQPYRLEMGTKLSNTRGKDLYAFWGEKITEEINHALQDVGATVTVNLASNEYFKAVKHKLLLGKLITPQFKDWKGDQYKMISFYAKKARGMMVRYCAQQGVDTPEALFGFNLDGYAYNPDLTENELAPVFTRRI